MAGIGLVFAGWRPVSFALFFDLAGCNVLTFAVLFVALLAFEVLAGNLPVIVLDLYLGASIITFAVYAFDKSAAKNNRWRTRERTLHVLALLGGWPGALAAQRIVRHKSGKKSFQVLCWATVALNCLMLVLFHAAGGK